MSLSGCYDIVLASMAQVRSDTAVDSLEAMLPASPFSEGGYMGLLIRTFLTLGIIIAVVWFLMRWVLPRIMQWRVASSGPMTLIDRLPLGANRSVCVLKAVGRYYLVGVSDGQIQLLKELDDGDVEAHYPAAAGKK